MNFLGAELSLLLLIQQVHLALYCYSGGLVNASLKLMYRARYLALMVYGEGHPDLATFDVCLACSISCDFITIGIWLYFFNKTAKQWLLFLNIING